MDVKTGTAGGGGSSAALMIGGLAVVGGLVYFLVIKPRQAQASTGGAHTQTSGGKKPLPQTSASRTTVPFKPAALTITPKKTQSTFGKVSDAYSKAGSTAANKFITNYTGSSQLGSAAGSVVGSGTKATAKVVGKAGSALKTGAKKLKFW